MGRGNAPFVRTSMGKQCAWIWEAPTVYVPLASNISAKVFGSRCERSTAVVPFSPMSNSVPGFTSPPTPSRITSEPSSECTFGSLGAHLYSSSSVSDDDGFCAAGSPFSGTGTASRMALAVAETPRRSGATGTRECPACEWCERKVVGEAPANARSGPRAACEAAAARRRTDLRTAVCANTETGLMVREQPAMPTPYARVWHA
jgi:hypothetical protein